MTGWRRGSLWIAANVVAALLVGASSCSGAWMPLIVLTAAFAVAQTAALVTASPRYLLWALPTLLGIPPAIWIAAVTVASFPRIGSDPSLLPGAALMWALVVVGSSLGWLGLSLFQMPIVWFAQGRRAALRWPLVVLAAAPGLDPLGVGLFTFPRPQAQFVGQPTPVCDVSSFGGGPLVWVLGAMWFGLVTLIVLRVPIRPR